MTQKKSFYRRKRFPCILLEIFLQYEFSLILYFPINNIIDHHYQGVFIV